MRDAGELLEIFRASGAYLDGHFRLTSGLHSNAYLQCALVLQEPGRAEALARLLAEKLRKLPGTARPDAVIGPATGGIILAHELARIFGCRAMFMERTPEGFKLRRGFSVKPGERVIVCEDVITTGGSVRETASALLDSGVEVPAIGVLVDRSAGKAELPAPYVALLSLEVPVWKPEECPLCREGKPIDTPGSKGLR